MNDSKKHLLTLGVIIILIALGIFWSTTTPKVTTKGWVNYTNTAFGFELQHPRDWKVAAFPENPAAPVFNIYKHAPDDTFPLTHHSRVAHVSIFPSGYPTEGIFGEYATSTVLFGEKTSYAIDFTLQNNERWGTYATFKNPPALWEPYGFVWAGVSIRGFGIYCVRDGEKLTEETCDPFTGETLLRTGTINIRERLIEEKILESFHFIDGASKELIRIDSPHEGDVISNPLVVRGEARGNWYFEASFPLVLTDWDGKIIAQGHATAQGEWMTEDFVPFEGVLSFDEPEDIGDFSDWGHLIFKKDNPSGLPQFDDAREFRIRFR